MKRIISIILTLTLSICIPISATETNNTSTYSVAEKKLLKYLQSNDEKLLVSRNGYRYMKFIEDFNSNALSLYLLGMTDKLIETGAKPDKEKYVEVLVNIIATYDLDNATDIAKQRKNDHLKSSKDYVVDFAEIGKNTVSVMVGNNPSASKMEKEISTAIDYIGELINDIDYRIEALSNLETVIQDYSKHDAFLKIIEDNTDGDLKKAAKTLRNSMTESMKIRLETYQNITVNTLENFGESLFTDISLDVLKERPEYKKDKDFKAFVDLGADFKEKIGLLDASWELGKKIGTLVGDITVGAEDLINRVLEMMALYDISIVLQEKVLEIGKDFLSNYEATTENSHIDTYITFSQYLVGCRIRGEYCLYSLVANDSGLLSWFNKATVEEVKKWYDKKAEQIVLIQDELLRILSAKDLGNIYNLYKEMVEQNIQQYGDATLKLNENEFRLSGVSYMDFMDFNNDGIEELLIYYQDGVIDSFIPKYKFKIYQYNLLTKVVEQIMEDEGCVITNGGYCLASVANVDSKDYLLTKNELNYFLYGEYEGKYIKTEIPTIKDMFEENAEILEENYLLYPFYAGDSASNKSLQETVAKINEAREKLSMSSLSFKLEKPFELAGTWYNEGYDETNNWAGSYKTIFHADGTVEQIGYRNKDIGTYKISENGTSVTAMYNQIYIDSPRTGGYELEESYSYTVTYSIDRNKDCLTAKYSQEFKERGISNAEDGVLRK